MISCFFFFFELLVFGRVFINLNNCPIFWDHLIGTGIFIGVASFVGGPTWVGLLVGLCLAVFARKHLDRKIDFADLVELVRGTLAAGRGGAVIEPAQ